MTTPDAFVAALAGSTPPQAPEGALDVVKVIVSLGTGVLVGLVTVTVTVDAECPSAGTEVGLSTTATALLAVWRIVPDPVWPLLASVAVIAQVPPVVLARYVNVATPEAFVLAGLAVVIVPQEPAGVADVVIKTGSLATAAPLFVTFTVITEVDTPSACKVAGLSLTVTPLAGAK